MKSLFSVALIICTGSLIFCQNTYLVNTGTEAYIELNNPITITKVFNQPRYNITANGNYQMFRKDFFFDGIKGLTIEVGFGALRGSNSTSDTLFVIDGFVSNGLIPRDSSSSVTYEETVIGGVNVIKVQWKNMTITGGNSAVDFVNFQIWLFENGQVEIRFGPTSLQSSAAQLFFPGNSGPSVGVFLSDLSLNMYESLFLIGQPGNPTADRSTPFAGLSGVPSNGRVYTFSYASSMSLEERGESLVKVFSILGTKEIVLTKLGDWNKEGTYQVLSSEGKVVSEGQLETFGTMNETRLSFPAVPNGCYLMKVQIGNTVVVRKFILL